MTFTVGDVVVAIKGTSDSFVRACQAAVDKLNLLPAATAKAGTGLSGLAHRFEQAEKAASKFSALSANMAHIGGAMAAIGAAGTLAGAGVIEVAKGVEQNLTFAASIAGKSEKDFQGSFDAMSAATKTFATQHQYTATQIAETFQNLARTGMSATTAIAAMPEVLRLATASGLDLAETAKVVTGTMSGYGIGVEDLNRVNNVLVGTFTNSNTTLAEVGEQLKMVGPIARSAGVSFEQIATAMGVLANAKLGAQSGTGLRTILAKVAEAGANAKGKSAKDLAELGISADTLAKGGLKGVVEQASKMYDGMQKSGQGIKFAQLALESFGQRGGPAFVALAAAGSKAFEDLAAKIENAKKVDLAKFIETKTLNTVEGSFHKLHGAVEALAMTLSTALAPAFKHVVDFVTSVINGFNSMNPNFQTAVGVVFALFVALSALVGTVGGFVAAVGMAIPGIVSLGTALGVTEVTVGGIATSLGTASIALATFLAAFYATSKLMDAFGVANGLDTNPFTVIKTAIDDATASLNGFLHVALSAFSVLMSLAATVQGAIQIASNPGGAVQAAFDGKQGPIGNGLDEVKKNHQALSDLIDQYVAAPQAKAAAAGEARGPTPTADTPDFEGLMNAGLTAQEAKHLAQQLLELDKALRKVGDEAEMASTSVSLQPFVKIRQQFGNVANDIRDKFAGIMSPLDQQALITNTNIAKAAAVRDELTKQIADSEITSAQQVEDAVNAAGLDVEMFTSALVDLGRAAKEREHDFQKMIQHGAGASGVLDKRTFVDPSKMDDVTKQVFGFVSSGAPFAGQDSDKNNLKAAAGASSSIVAGLSQGVAGAMSTAAGAIGAGIGGPVGNAVAQAILSVAEQWAQNVGEAIGTVLQTLFSDKRIGDALGGAQQGANAAGAAMGLSLLATVVASALLPAAIVLGAIFVGLSVVTLGFFDFLVAVVGAVVAFLAAIVLMPAIMGGLVGGFLSLATQTKSYARMQGALSVVVDKLVAAFEPFFANALAIVGLFSVLASVFSAFIAGFVDNEGLWEILFGVIKDVGIVVGAFGVVVAFVYDCFVKLADAVVWLATFISSGFSTDAANAAAAAVDNTSVNLGNLIGAVAALTGLTYSHAKAIGEDAAATWDAQKATKGLTEGIINGPIAFRVQQYEFGAQGGPQQMNTGVGTGTVDSSETVGVTVHGDMNVTVVSNDAEKFAKELDETARKATGQARGNPYHPHSNKRG